MFVHRTKKLLAWPTSVGSDMPCSRMQTEKTPIRQLLQELPDLGLMFAKELKSIAIGDCIAYAY